MELAAWSPSAAVQDFVAVAALAGVTLNDDDVSIEILPAPHRSPTRLPVGCMAVYVFSRTNRVLKVGKVGAKSQARYTSQHYLPGSAGSTLAASLLADVQSYQPDVFEHSTVGEWIRGNVDRVNLILDHSKGMAVLSLLESFLQCRLNPVYEGFKSQR